MYYFENIIQKFNKMQFLVGELEDWQALDDVSPEQKEYEDTLPTIEQEEEPF
jgi:hypothetical protein